MGLFLLTFSVFLFNTAAMMPSDERQEGVLSLIREADADFVFLTEEYSGQMTGPLSATYPYAAHARSHIDITERFYSKHPIVDIADIGTLTSGGYTDTWVHRVRVLVDGRDTVSVYCCHLPHAIAERMAIADAILRDIPSARGKVIVGGDMNSITLSSPIFLFRSAGLLDCWAEKGSGDGATFHGLPLGVRIDYIFHSDDLHLRSVRRIGAASLSDHDALFASFD